MQWAVCYCLTNDENAFLRETDVAHPTAKKVIEVSWVHDEEVEMEQRASSFSVRDYHDRFYCN